MKLRRAFVLGCIVGFVSSVSFSSMASAQEQDNQELPYNQMQSIWSSLDPAQKRMVDLVAADFFQRELSASQQDRIVASQAEKYRSASPVARDKMRQSRRTEWNSRSVEDRRSALLSAGGTYSVLTENQKAPFRLYAIDKLALRPVLSANAPSRKNAV